MLEEQETAFLFRDILRLNAETPLPIGLADTRLRKPDARPLREHLEQWQLRDGLGSSLISAMEAYVV